MPKRKENVIQKGTWLTKTRLNGMRGEKLNRSLEGRTAYLNALPFKPRSEKPSEGTRKKVHQQSSEAGKRTLHLVEQNLKGTEREKGVGGGGGWGGGGGQRYVMEQGTKKTSRTSQ